MGAAIAALVRVTLSTPTVEWISSQPLLTVPAMMLFAILISLCSEADAFVAASFGTVGVGGKLAMLVLGPMLDLKLLVMYRWVFAKTAVKTLVKWLLGLSFLIGVAAQLAAPLLLPYACPELAEKNAQQAAKKKALQDAGTTAAPDQAKTSPAK